MLSSRIDYQDAVAKGLGVTEYAGEGRAAQEIAALWGGNFLRVLRIAEERAG